MGGRSRPRLGTAARGCNRPRTALGSARRRAGSEDQMHRRRAGGAVLRHFDEAARPAHDVHVFERNAEGVTFGWGVVFSDQTVENLMANDPGLGRQSSPTNSPIGTTSTSISTAQCDPLVGPRLHRHRPQAPARNPRRPRPRARRRDPLRARVRPRPRRMDATGTWSSPPTASTAASAKPMPSISASTSRSAPTASSGSARPRRSTPSPSPSRRPRRAGSGPTPIASPTIARPSSSNARRRPGRRSASTGWSQAEAIAACERIFAKYLDGQPLLSNAAAPARLGGVAQVPPDHLRTLAPRQADPARRRRPHRAFLDRVGDQAGARGCDQAGRGAQPPRPRPDRGAGRISGRADPRGAQAAEQRAQLDRMVRDGRALSRLRAVAVRLFAADPVAADQPRESAPARRRLAGADRSALSGSARPARRKDRAADVRAVQAARDGARRTASSSRRWRCIRRSTGRPTTSTWSISARARRAARGWSSPR